MIKFNSTVCIKKTPKRTLSEQVKLFKGFVRYFFLFQISYALPVSYSKSTNNAHMDYTSLCFKTSLHPHTFLFGSVHT